MRPPCPYRSLALVLAVLLELVAGLLTGCGSGGAGDVTPSPTPAVDQDGDGYSAAGGPAPVDCDDQDPNIHPDGLETCNGRDDNCDGQIDEGLPTEVYFQDADSDGYGDPDTPLVACSQPVGYLRSNTDCDDQDLNSHPGGVEVCDNADNDCDGEIDEGFDADGDGFTPCSLPPDCDDEDPDLSPDAPELCDHIDNNCDGQIDEIFPDADHDGYASCDGALDCNDTNATAYPGALEVCGNSIDEDCDGVAGVKNDVDGDGYNTCDKPFDCDESDPSVYPGALEVCNGQDDNCDGRSDEGYDKDGDGVTLCASPPDCNDQDPAVYPGTDDICFNSVDENCDGIVGTSSDSDGDGFYTCGPAPYDCLDTDSSVYPGASEQCDAKDNDCNRVIDDGLTGPDAFEPNESAGTAYNLGTIDGGNFEGATRILQASIAGTTDKDWFQFHSIDESLDYWEIKITLSQIPAGANYDVYLFAKGSSSSLAKGTGSGNADESIKYEGQGGVDNTGDYLVEIVWKSGSYGCPKYSLSIYGG